MADDNVKLETSEGTQQVEQNYTTPPPLPNLLFFTYANAKYHVFATLYPLFALESNPDAIVEIILSDYELFKRNYSNIMEFYDTNYPGKVRYTSVDKNPLIAQKKVMPHTARFVIEPTLKAKYVYIGDIDIFLMEDVLDYWLNFMEKHQCDFGNILRPNAPDHLTGLHFIPYDKMYPVIILKEEDLLRIGDEILLCQFMKAKNLRFPVNAMGGERKIHGLHISYFSRPPLPSMTTFDKPAIGFPSWNTLDKYLEKYLEIRYTKPIIKFTECLDKKQVELRRLIQIIDMWAFFLKEHPGKTLFDRNAAPDKATSSKNEPPIETASKQKEQSPVKVPLEQKKNLDFLLNRDYDTACDRQDILSRFED